MLNIFQVGIFKGLSLTVQASYFMNRPVEHKMHRRELLRRFPNASSSFLEVNAALSHAESQRNRRQALGAGASDEKSSPGGPLFRVVIVSYRLHLLDEDNLRGGCKFLIDAMRYEGLIPGDAPKHATFDVRQEQVALPEEECTVIEIYRQTVTA